MTEEEQKQESEQAEQAVLWIKANKKIILEKFATGLEYAPDTQPTTLFMAGSPGAGKQKFRNGLFLASNKSPSG